MPPRLGRFALPVLAILAAMPATSRAADPATPPPPRVRAWQTGLLAPDRLQHFSLSVTLGLGAGIASGRPTAAFAGAFALGLAKELHDRRRSRFDPADLAADAAGAALAALVTRSLTR